MCEVGISIFVGGAVDGGTSGTAVIGGRGEAVGADRTPDGGIEVNDSTYILLERCEG